MPTSRQSQYPHQTVDSSYSPWNPQSPLPFKYDNWTQMPERKRNRNRNRKQRSRNRRRTLSTTSTNDGHNDGHNDGRSDSRNDGHNDQQKYYRSRAASNVSISGHSVVSAMTNETKSNRGTGNIDRGQWNLRWDRDRLSREIWSFYLDHKQTPDLLTRKYRLRDALHKILTSNFPKYEVELFIVGSTANGLANNRSDVDICLVMNEINGRKVSTTPSEKQKESNILDKLIPSNGDEQKARLASSDAKERTEVGIIVNYEDSDPAIDKSNDSHESVGTNPSATNGANDPSIPMLEMVEEVLKAYNFVTKMQIIMAKVPILKFVDRISSIEVTINVNKLVSIRNTHLINDYTKLDWRVQPLVMVIKAWAKDHTINDAYNKSISSYSLALMVIHYLQFACEPPVLPCLQEREPDRYRPDGDLKDIRMDRKPRRWKSQNHSTLKELLVGFLDYYSYSFCYNKDAISIRLGKTLPKHIVQRFKSEENQFSHWKFLCIEEPFNRTNTARSVYDEVTFERILSVFRVSHYTLRRYPILDSIMTGKQFNSDYSNDIDQYVNSNSN